MFPLQPGIVCCLSHAACLGVLKCMVGIPLHLLLTEHTGEFCKCGLH